MISETKNCQNCRAHFVIEPEDFSFYKKIDVPPPTWCPDCRLQRRLSFFNERVLYKRKCDLCAKVIVNMYAPDSGLTVYCNSCWWSDNWDPLSYGRDYDPTRSFFEQFKELIRATPQVALWVNYPTLVNSNYINHAATSKNCYLIFTADYCENVMYSSILANMKDSMDCFSMEKSELCYQDIMCGAIYNTHFSEDCDNCSNVLFSKNCVGCSDCIGCINLRQKKFHIFNKPYSKEEYQEEIKKFNFKSRSFLKVFKEQAAEFWKTQPQKSIHSIHNTNVSGDYVYNSKNSKDIFLVQGVEDSKYCQIITLPTTKDCYDYSMWGNGAQRVYESILVGEGADNVKFGISTWPECRDVEYSYWTMSSANMFGCANIRKKEYCILNKQYSKESFDKLRTRIIAEMNTKPYVDSAGREYRYGEFFPPELSLHTYNETYANDFFPLTEEDAKKEGFSWKQLPFPPQSPTLKGALIPDNIDQTSDSILKEILECESCSKPFLIIPSELALLRRFEFPVPNKCFNCRYTERISRINPPRLWDRTCAKCKTKIETSYSPDRPEIVYCEQCYNEEVA